MNREIKFRAWDNVLKQFLPNIQNHLGNNEWAFGNILKENGNRYHVGQWTGLNDKNGKEIYEGDLVAEIDSLSDLKNWGEPLQVVFGEFETHKDSWGLSYRTIGFMLKYPDQSGFTGLHQGKSSYGFHANKLLIVGNVFETPELLNNQ